MFRRRREAYGIGSLLAVIALIFGILDLAHIALGGLPLVSLAIILLALAILL